MARVTETLQTPDGIMVSLDVYHEGDRDTALVICPGFFQSKETPTFQRMSEALLAKRDVLSMDFRGHGKSTGLYTFSAKESADLEVVLKWAKPRYQRIGVMGFSLGGAIAINTLRWHPKDAQTLIAVSAPCVFEDVEFKFWTPEALRTGFKGMEPGAGCRPGNPLMPKERPLDTIQLFRQFPVLFVHGTNDVIVSLKHSERLFEVTPEPKEMKVIQNGSHAEALFRDDPQEFIELVDAWLMRKLHAS